MGHIEGFDSDIEGDLDKFIKRVKEIWQTEKSRSKGAQIRYGLTIGIRSKIAILDPMVTTGKGMKTLIIWNLKTEDTKTIKDKANDIELTVTECPYLWSEMPVVLPNEKPL